MQPPRSLHKQEIAKLVRIQIQEIVIYELTEHEIDILERGKSNIKLTWSATLFGAAFSLVISLLTDEMNNQYVTICFKFSIAFLCLLSLILFTLHRKEKDSYDQVISKIRERRKERLQAKHKIERH